MTSTTCRTRHNKPSSFPTNRQNPAPDSGRPSPLHPNVRAGFHTSSLPYLPDEVTPPTPSARFPARNIPPPPPYLPPVPSLAMTLRSPKTLYPSSSGKGKQGNRHTSRDASTDCTSFLYLLDRTDVSAPPVLPRASVPFAVRRCGREG